MDVVYALSRCQILLSLIFSAHEHGMFLSIDYTNELSVNNSAINEAEQTPDTTLQWFTSSAMGTELHIPSLPV